MFKTVRCKNLNYNFWEWNVKLFKDSSRKDYGKGSDHRKTSLLPLVRVCCFVHR